ncbi:MAG: glycosyltransferase family 2 protein [Gaiellaceae bacterium]
MNDLPEVTVVIPTKDRWHVLSRAALRSVLSQEGVDLELVVVDDGSRDGTSERLAALGDERVHVVRNEQPLGVAKARNAGIGVARGAWISFLDDDDLWSPRKLREQLDAATAADALFVYASGAAIDGAHRFLFNVAAPEPETIAEQLLQWNVIWCGCSNVSARADVVRRLGGFDEELFQLADWDLWIRLALSGRAAACRDVLVAYTIHQENMLLTHAPDVFPELERLVAKHGAAATERGVEIDRARFARWVAGGHRRAGRRRQAVAAYLDSARRQRDAGAALRAVGTLFGEPALALARRAVRPDRRSSLPKLALPEPAWLGDYR